MKNARNLTLVLYIFFVTGTVQGMRSQNAVADTLNDLQKSLSRLADVFVIQKEGRQPVGLIAPTDPVGIQILNQIRSAKNPFEALYVLDETQIPGVGRYVTAMEAVPYLENEIVKKFPGSIVKEMRNALAIFESGPSAHIAAKQLKQFEMRPWFNYLKNYFSMQFHGESYADAIIGEPSKPAEVLTTPETDVAKVIVERFKKTSNPFEAIKILEETPIPGIGLYSTFADPSEVQLLESIIEKKFPGSSIAEMREAFAVFNANPSEKIAAKEIKKYEQKKWFDYLKAYFSSYFRGKKYEDILISIEHPYAATLDEIYYAINNNIIKSPLAAAKELEALPYEVRLELKDQWNNIDNLFSKKWELRIHTAISLNDMVEKKETAILLKALQQWKNRPWAETLLREMGGTQEENLIKKQILAELAKPQTRNPFTFVQWIKDNNFRGKFSTTDPEIDEAFKKKFKVTQGLYEAGLMHPLEEYDRGYIRRTDINTLLTIAIAHDESETLRKDMKWQRWAQDYIGELKRR